MNIPTMRKSVAVSCTVALLCAQHAGAVVTVCVHDANELQSALTAAQGSTQQQIIGLAEGTYAAADTFVFYSVNSNQGQLDISGGYDSTCSTASQTPARTILDGGAAQVVMKLESWNGISVRWLTVRNGYESSNVGGAAGLVVESITGGVIVHYNIFQANVSAASFGGLYAAVAPDEFGTTSSADLSVWGNLIVDNASATQPGGSGLYNSGSGTIYLTGNTIANNVLTQAGAGLTGGVELDVAATATAYASNNIVYGSSDNTYDLASQSALLLTDNDIGFSYAPSLDPASSGNLSVAPRFVGNGNYHLRGTSTLFEIGTLTPPGGLATIDLDNHPRTFNGALDLGAYQRGDPIFTDGFDG